MSNIDNIIADINEVNKSITSLSFSTIVILSTLSFNDTMYAKYPSPSPNVITFP